MARKFLYFVAGLVVLLLALLLALRLWSKELTDFAFVPRVAFEQQKPLTPTAYDNAAMWYFRPGMKRANPADWMPKGWTKSPAAPSRAAVFFVHPTSYFGRNHWNAPLDDAASNVRAELFIKAMASPFNRSADLWAPRYRQAAIGAFLAKDPSATKAFDVAYADVLEAFDTFIKNVPENEPVILVGHSQGAMHLMRLLKERVAGTPLARRVIAAYVIGWPVSTTHDLPMMGLPACNGPDQAGCVMSWESFGEPADPSMVLDAYAASPGLDGRSRAGSPILCTNPLTGGAGGSAPASANLGTLVPNDRHDDGTIERGMVPARCAANGLLLIGEAPDIGGFVLPGNNYHLYDIPLFWANLRQDAARREAAWWKAH